MIIKRTFDLFERFEQYPDTIGKMTIASKENGEWKKYSTKEYREKSNYFSYGLLSLGFKRGDKIATITNNRTEWNFVDMGSAHIGIVHVPIFPIISQSEFEHILTHSDVKLVIVSSKELYDTINEIKKVIPNLQDIYTFDKIEEVKN